MVLKLVSSRVLEHFASKVAGLICHVKNMSSLPLSLSLSVESSFNDWLVLSSHRMRSDLPMNIHVTMTTTDHESDCFPNYCPLTVLPCCCQRTRHENLVKRKEPKRRTHPKYANWLQPSDHNNLIHFICERPWWRSSTLLLRLVQ